MRKFTDIEYHAGGGNSRSLDLYLPEGSGFPVFVFFHGGGIERGDKAGEACATVLPEYFTSKGIAFASANYRMYPAARYPDYVLDAAEAVAWVRNNICDYGGDGRVIVGGSSAGGYLSMMLCYDKSFLGKWGIEPHGITAFVHDAGQPTTHFNIVKLEYGLDRRRVIVDEKAPLYHIGEAAEYAPQLFFVSDNDIGNRYEQTVLIIGTLKDLGYDMDRVELRYMEGYSHTRYLGMTDEKGVSIFGTLAYDFLKKYL